MPPRAAEPTFVANALSLDHLLRPASLTQAFQHVFEIL
jgi:hypothetical protein